MEEDLKELFGKHVLPFCAKYGFDIILDDGGNPDEDVKHVNIDLEKGILSLD